MTAALPRAVGEVVGEARRLGGGAHGLRRADVLVPAGAYRRRPPVFMETTHLEPAHAGLLGTYLGTLLQQHDALLAIRLAGATVAGQGAVVTAGGAMLRESVAEFLAQSRAPDGFSGDAEQGFALALPVTRAVGWPCVLLKRPWHHNYGHWLVDGAGLAALLARARLAEGTRLVVGAHADAAMRQVVADTLAVVAPGLDLLEQPDDEAWTFDDLLYLSPAHVPPLFKLPESVAGVRATLLRDRLARGGAGRRLFVVRPEGAPRRLGNEAALLADAAARGFEVARPETLPVLEQARLFHAAECVVGVKGAALANLLFCRPDASAVVLSPADWPDPFFWDVAGQVPLRYAEVFGPLVSRDAPPSRNPFTVDPAHLAAALDAVL